MRDSYLDPTRSCTSAPLAWSRRNWAMRELLLKADAQDARRATLPARWRVGWLRLWKRIHGAREVC